MDKEQNNVFNANPFIFGFMETKHKWLAIEHQHWNNHIFKNGNLLCKNRKKCHYITIYHVAFSLPHSICVDAFSEVLCTVHIVHSKNILNTDLLQTKIKMSWERNKSSAKLDCCSFDAHLMREIPDVYAITYTQHSRHIHSSIHSLDHNRFRKSLPFSLYKYVNKYISSFHVHFVGCALLNVSVCERSCIHSHSTLYNNIIKYGRWWKFILNLSHCVVLLHTLTHHYNSRNVFAVLSMFYL